MATATRTLVAAVAGTDARICCTRKTTPGLRALEKQAVRAAGGVNHRHGLGDAILIKDNHVAASGCVAAAIAAAKRQSGPATAIEVEVDTLDQLNEALEAGATAVLLDNMTPPDLRRAVEMPRGRAVLEASGQVTARTSYPKYENHTTLHNETSSAVHPVPPWGDRPDLGYLAAGRAGPGAGFDPPGYNSGLSECLPTE